MIHLGDKYLLSKMLLLVVLLYQRIIGLPKYMDLWFLMFAKTCVYINRFNTKTRYMTHLIGSIKHFQ